MLGQCGPPSRSSSLVPGFKRRRSSVTSIISRSRPPQSTSGTFNCANIFPVHHGVGGTEDQERPLQRMYSPVSFSRQDSSSLHFNVVLQIFSKLLSAYEVKFTLELIDRLSNSRFGTYSFNASADQIIQDFQQSACEAQDAALTHMKGPLSIIETVFCEMSSADARVRREGVISHGTPWKPQRTSNGNLNSRNQETWETTSINSTNSSISKASKKSRGSQESMRRMSEKLHTIQSQDACDFTCVEDAENSAWADSEIPRIVSGELGQPRIISSPDGGSLLGEVAPAKQATDPIFSPGGSASDISEKSPQVSGEILSASLPRSGFKRTATCLLSSPKQDLSRISDRGIDLDDVSLEQAQILAAASDGFIIHPNNTFRVAWDLVVLILIVWECITLPLSLAFDMMQPQSFYILSYAIFGTDMVACFTTGYYHRDILIMRRRRIIRHYLQTWFLLDMISLFPWEEIFFFLLGGGTSNRSGTGNKTIVLRVLKLGKLMRVFRLLRVAKITNLIKQLQSNGILAQNLLHLNYRMSVIKMFIIFGFASHWCACVWGWVGRPEALGHSSEYEPVHAIELCTMGGPCEAGIEGAPWRHRYGMENYDKLTQYLAALHFAAALITGGETPMTASYPAERLFTIAVMFGSLLVISSVVGEILLIINRQGETKIAFDEQMQQAQDFMSARSVAASLQVRVLRYMETQFEIQHGNESGSNRTFMQALSEGLQSELIEGLNRPLLMQHPFFAKLQDMVALSYVSQQAVPVIFASSEIICLKGEPATCAYWIVSGKVRVDTPLISGGSELYLKPPCWLGDMCLFVETLRKASVTAVVTTETLCLQKSIIRDACENFPSLKADFEVFRDVVMKEKFESLVCPLCRDIGHSEEQCPEQKHKKVSRATNLMGRVRSTMITRMSTSGPDN